MSEQDYSRQQELFYLLDVIRDVKSQQPDKSLMEIISDVLALEPPTLNIEWFIPLKSDESLCKLLSTYHDKIYQQQFQEKFKSNHKD